MDGKKRLRCVYVTARQKKKLLECITEHPELISCKVTQGFNYNVSQNLWNNIAAECNSIPGARKTWRQWRKTWHDLRSKTKKRYLEKNGDLPRSLELLTPTEQEALGVNSIKSNAKKEFSAVSEFIPVEEDYDDVQSEAAESAPESPPEAKVFTRSQNKNKVKEVKSNKHECVFNCDMLALQEQRKIDVKEDYLKFKKEYLKQKLKCMQEQTEALKTIARELSK